MISAQSQIHYFFFGFLIIVVSVLYMRSKEQQQHQTSYEFQAFRRTFLIIYFCAFMADWLQGPYLFKVYREYQLHSHDIALLYITQYASDLVFGTLIGALGDKWGRKRNCILYGVLYSAAQLTFHSSNYKVLLAGRVLAGLSTSILYSAFESWMVQHHRDSAYPTEWRSRTFELMALGNGVLAIVAGVLAFILTETSSSYLAPFDCSLIFLAVSTIMVMTSWKENYGSGGGGSGGGVLSGMQQACTVFFSNSKVALLGVIQSCFEAPMLILLYIWTPALEDALSAKRSASRMGKMLNKEAANDVGADVSEEVAKEKLLGAVMPDTPGGIPHGLIFACFMVSVMIGSLVFNSVAHDNKPVHDIARSVYATGTLALALPILFTSHWVRLFAFCIFYACVGLHYPCIGTLRAGQIQAEVRTTVMNMFRIGLNLITIAILHNIDLTTDQRQGERQAFMVCAALVLVATLAQHRLKQLLEQGDGADDSDDDGDDLP